MLNKMLANTLKLEMLNAKAMHEKIAIIAKYAKRATDAERCSIFLYTKDTDQLRSIYADGVTEDIVLKSNIGIVGYVFHKKIPIIENNTSNSPLFFKAMDQKTHYKTDTILAIPIFQKEDRAGVIELLNKAEGFTKEDQTSIETLSKLIANILAEDIHNNISRTHQPAPTLLEKRLDTYLVNKKLYLMEDGSAYYKVLGMKREFFLAADICYLLNEESKRIQMSYYTSNHDFLSIDMLAKIDTEMASIFISENAKESQFNPYTLEEE